MTREEAIYELGEWLEQMIQHGVPSHSAKRKALATAIALLADESEQNRPQGEWIARATAVGDKEYIEYSRCSECGEIAFVRMNYCPNCGADMRGDNNE